MGIDLHWENESGASRQIVVDDDFYVSEIIAASMHEKTTCLGFIDPYGDTVFNQDQLSHLKAEIQSIPESALSDGAKIHRKKLLVLLDEATDQTHTYLKFYGD